MLPLLRRSGRARADTGTPRGRRRQPTIHVLIRLFSPSIYATQMSQVLLDRLPGSIVQRLEVRRPLRWLRWGLVCWVILFWKLHWLSLLDPDEAHYAQLTHEMIRGHSWFVPLLDGAPYVDKPVLFHWLQMLSVSVFGETEFALRMPSACAA